MPTLRSLLRHVFSSETVLYECRNCGSTLEAETEQCSECGAFEVASYRFTS
jgi:rubrerythrin